MLHCGTVAKLDLVIQPESKRLNSYYLHTTAHVEQRRVQWVQMVTSVWAKVGSRSNTTRRTGSALHAQPARGQILSIGIGF